VSESQPQLAQFWLPDQPDRRLHGVITSDHGLHARVAAQLWPGLRVDIDVEHRLVLSDSLLWVLTLALLQRAGVAPALLTQHLMSHSRYLSAVDTARRDMPQVFAPR